jgi:hypothetical protein
MFPVGGVEYGTEGRPIASHRVNVKLVLRVKGLWSGQQVVTNSVAEVNVDFIETTLTVTETVEVFIDMLPLAILLIGLHLEVGKEISFQLVLVEEVVAFVYDTLIASASQCFGFLCHALVVVPLALILRLGKDVNAK